MTGDWSILNFMYYPYIIYLFISYVIGGSDDDVMWLWSTLEYSSEYVLLHLKKIIIKKEINTFLEKSVSELD